MFAYKVEPAQERAGRVPSPGSVVMLCGPHQSYNVTVYSRHYNSPRSVLVFSLKMMLFTSALTFANLILCRVVDCGLTSLPGSNTLPINVSEHGKADDKKYISIIFIVSNVTTNILLCLSVRNGRGK